MKFANAHGAHLHALAKLYGPPTDFRGMQPLEESLTCVTRHPSKSRTKMRVHRRP